MIYKDDPPAPAQTPNVSGEGHLLPGAETDTPQSSASAITASDAPLTPSDPSHPPDFNRHARRCVVCSHPDRDAIEGDFIRWRSPKNIAQEYHIADRSSFYRHAHAAGLFARRRREFARVLEDILENVEDCSLENTADVIIRAARVYAHLDANGNWVEPRRTNILLTGPAPAQFIDNQHVEISAEPMLHHEVQQIPSTLPKKRSRTCKSKRQLSEVTVGTGKAKKRLMETHPTSKNGSTR